MQDSRILPKEPDSRIPQSLASRLRAVVELPQARPIDSAQSHRRTRMLLDRTPLGTRIRGLGCQRMTRSGWNVPPA